MMSLHNLDIVLIYNFIVDRRLYLDVAFYSLSEKARRRGGGMLYTVHLCSNKALSSPTHGADVGRRSCAPDC